MSTDTPPAHGDRDNGHPQPAHRAAVVHIDPGIRIAEQLRATEAALLGAMLATTPEGAAARRIAQAHRFTADTFTNSHYGRIHDAITAVDQAGEAVDVLTVGTWLAKTGQLGDIGGPEVLIGLLDACPARSNAPTYAKALLGPWRQRVAHRLIVTASEEVRGGAEPLEAVTRITERLPVPAETGGYLELDEFLDTDEPEYDWLIPGLLEANDRCIITAEEGTGKSVLLRQIGITAASGLHPFTHNDIDPLTVLHIDTENSERQIRRHLNPLRQVAGERYEPGRYHLRVTGSAINLADRQVELELAQAIERIEPRVITIGPLYKLGEGDPKDEQTARAIADCFDRLRGICQSAVIIEAHSPYADSPKAKRVIRPYGASLWSRWPEFGWYFNKDGNVEHWRGQREERDWPTGLTRGKPWPFTATFAPSHTPQTWDGPTHCIEAIVHVLGLKHGEEFSTNQLVALLKATGNSYHRSTVATAAEQAALAGRIVGRPGPNRARIYSASDNPQPDLGPGF